MNKTMLRIIAHVRDHGIHDMNRAHFGLKRRVELLNSSIQLDEAKKAGNSIAYIAEELYKNGEWIKMACEAMTSTYETYYDVKNLFELINQFRSKPIKYNKNDWSSPSLHCNKYRAFAKLLWISYWFKEASASDNRVTFSEPSYEWTVVEKEAELNEMELKGFEFNIGAKTLTVKF